MNHGVPVVNPAPSRADHCIGCGRCAVHCPQSINIPREMALIDEWVDSLKNEEARR